MQGCLKLVGVAIVALLLAMLSFLSGFGVSATGGSASPIAAVQTALPGLPNIVQSAAAPPQFTVFWEAWNIIQKDFYGKIPTNKELTYGAIQAVLKTLNDQHTVFIEPQGTAQENEQLRGDFQGIGANVNLIGGQVVIVSPIPGSPAEKAGVLAGDIILKVGDKDVTGLSLDEVVALIRGPKGSTVNITFQRKNQANPIVLDIVRNTIQLPSVIAKMQENNVGYIRLTIFGEKSKDEVVNAINDLKKQGAKGLIFDLRGNPGGYLQTAIDVASQFIPDGIVAYERGKNGVANPFRAGGNGAWMNLPMVVLIDKGSASASEIVSGAIQDLKRAPLLGETSFGKGSVQSVHQLSDKSSVHVTIAEWLTPNMTQITGKGLTPDLPVTITTDDQKAGIDSQLQAAIKYLKEKM